MGIGFEFGRKDGSMIYLILILLIVASIILCKRGIYADSDLKRQLNGNLKEAGLPKDEYEKCMIWAFGENALSMTLLEMPDNWQHKELFELSGDDPVSESTVRIGKAYLGRMIA